MPLTEQSSLNEPCIEIDNFSPSIKQTMLSHRLQENDKLKAIGSTDIQNLKSNSTGENSANDISVESHFKNHLYVYPKLLKYDGQKSFSKVSFDSN